jgi:hypothetical protein
LCAETSRCARSGTTCGSLWGTLDKLFRDGKQIEHRTLLEMLLQAS